MDTTTATRTIVDALTKAIVEHRLHPGSKLAEQKLADHFGVSRTLVRQALFQLAQKRLIRMEPARGAFVATREFVRSATKVQIQALQEHVAQEKAAVQRGDVAGRTDLLGDFHVRMAELMGNPVLGQILGELISRCSLITLMYQSDNAAEHSAEDHAAILKAIIAKNENLAVELMEKHLRNVEASLTLDRKIPMNNIAMALA
jgi:DNA-binding GntR family transcriptional regulator